MSLSTYNDTPFGIKELGSVYLTELAKEIQQIQADPLGQFLPQMVTPEREVRVEWVESNLRVTGVVRPGMPNKLNTFAKAKTQVFTPAVFRRGQFIDQDVINHLRAPGTMSQTYGMDLVREQLTELVEQGNMMMSVLRAQMLSGGIDYTDPETGVNISAVSGIPAGNYYTIGTTAPTASSLHWHDPNSTPVTDLMNIMYRAELEGRNKPTHMIINGALLHLLRHNLEVKKYYPGNDTTAFAQTGLVTFGQDGYPNSIAGLQIVVVNTIYDDLDNTGALVRRYMWPVNKVTIFSQNHPSLPGQVLGNTWITKGENPTGGTGPWVTTWDYRQMGGPTTAPGVGMQFGMAGIPVIKKPYWVHVITAATVGEITATTGTKYVV